MKALYFEIFGEADVLKYGELPDPMPQSGEALIRTEAIGLNFADIYRRRGNYHLAGNPPYILGYEAAGTIESLPDSDNLGFKAGDRVAFADSPFSNAELVAVNTQKLVKLPDDISFESAAAVMLQGLTAHYLTRDSHFIKPGESALVHAAAGGVGLLLTQIIKILGGCVFGLVSSEEKRRAAIESGADEVCLYSEDWVKKARDFGGNGIDVVYDSVGSTLDDSLTATKTGGHVVFYGMAGGDPEFVDPRRLMDKSKTLTGGDLWNVLTSHEERVKRSNELFGWISEGKLKVTISKSFSLADGAEAHRFLESRKSIGKVLLIPSLSSMTT